MTPSMTYEYSRCECHDCTQARWKMSFQWQSIGGGALQAQTGAEAAMEQQKMAASISAMEQKTNQYTGPR